MIIVEFFFVTTTQCHTNHQHFIFILLRIIHTYSDYPQMAHALKRNTKDLLSFEKSLKIFKIGIF